MALVVETGAVTPGANSYVTVAEADSYFSDRNNTAWAALSVPQKEAALIQGTDYIQQEFYGRWQGSVISGSQPLDWPRQYVVRRYVRTTDRSIYDLEAYFPSDAIPDFLKQAVYLLAIDQAAIALTQTPVQPQSSGGGGAVIEETVGPLTVKYAEPTSNSGLSVKPSFPAVMRLVEPFLKNPRNSRMIVRS